MELVGARTTVRKVVGASRDEGMQRDKKNGEGEGEGEGDGGEHLILIYLNSH